MARVPNIFYNPATAETYNWPINHNEEDAAGKSRQMADGAATNNMGLIPQQGAPTPLIFTWKGVILTMAQHEAMLHWWSLCEQNSIYVTDFEGSKYEIIITDYAPQRKYASANRNDLANMPTWTIEYTLTFRVLTVFNGPWVGVVP